MQSQSEYLSARQLADRLNIGLSTIWAQVKRGTLPQPDLKVGKRCSRWNWQNVLVYLKEKENGGNNEPH